MELEVEAEGGNTIIDPTSSSTRIRKRNGIVVVPSVDVFLLVRVLDQNLEVFGG